MQINKKMQKQHRANIRVVNVSNRNRAGVQADVEAPGGQSNGLKDICTQRQGWCKKYYS